MNPAAYLEMAETESRHWWFFRSKSHSLENDREPGSTAELQNS